MGLFEDISRTIKEAIEEAQQDPRPQPQRSRGPAPQRRPEPEPEPEPAPTPAIQEELAERQRKIAATRERLERTREQQATTPAGPGWAQKTHAGTRGEDIRTLLRSPNGLRNAILLSEILGQPLAKRGPHGRRR